MPAKTFTCVLALVAIAGSIVIFCTIAFQPLCSTTLTQGHKLDPPPINQTYIESLGYKLDILINKLNISIQGHKLDPSPVNQTYIETLGYKLDILINKFDNPTQQARQSTSESFEPCTSASELSAIVDRIGEPRVFKITQCSGHERVTLHDLYPVFAAHQVEWSIMGKEAPWWSVLTNLPKSQTIPESMKDDFYASGEQHVNLLLRAMRAETVDDEWALYATVEPQLEEYPIDIVSANVKSPFKLKPHSSGSPFGKVLDFGCGLGRLALNFAKVGSDCTCVDQSMHHLRVAEIEWKKRRGDSQQEIHFVPSTTDLLSAVKGERFDFVHSVLVLQHMVPQLQAVYLEQFCDILRVGGQGWVQIPLTWDFAGKERCNVMTSIETGGMQMHGTPAVYIQSHFEARGCEVQVLDLSRRYIGGGKSGLVLFRKMK